MTGRGLVAVAAAAGLALGAPIAIAEDPRIAMMPVPEFGSLFRAETAMVACAL